MDKWYVKAIHITKRPKFNKKYYKNTRFNRKYRSEYYTIHQYFGHISYGIYIDLEYTREVVNFEYKGNKLIVGDKLIANGIKYEVISIEYNSDDGYGVYVMKDILNDGTSDTELLEVELEKMQDYIPEFRKMIVTELSKRSLFEIVKDWFRY